MVVLTDSAQVRYHEEIGIPPKRIYNPLSFKTKTQSKLNSRKLIFIGRLVYFPKRLDFLIKIISKLNELSIDFSIDIVGDGSDFKKLYQEVSQLKLENKVNFVGATNDVESHILKSSICLVPSQVEGFGLVITEAMACGVPVISFATEGPSEIIFD